MVVQPSLVEDLAVSKVFERSTGREENLRCFERYFIKKKSTSKVMHQISLQRYVIGDVQTAEDVLRGV